METLAEEKRQWPPVYDQRSLDEAIKRGARALPKQFYLTSFDDPEPCQGDVIELAAEVPILDEEGQASTDGDATYWLVVANTCDVARAFEDHEDVVFLPLAPLIPATEMELEADLERAVRNYELSRMFFVPPWDETSGTFVADFTRFVPVHRSALRQRAAIRARMRLDAWVLLNACLVRLLCREDKRHG